MAEILAAALFGFGYLAISFEHRLFVNKAATSSLIAVLLWLVVALTLPRAATQHAIGEAATDIFGIVIFLLTAMTLVEILLHYHFFDSVERWLRKKELTYYNLAWLVAGIAFFFSAWLDNLTATIVAMQITRRLYPKEYLIPMGALVVITANAGGSFSPIGDVTTLMLWFAGKFSASRVIVEGILPSIALALVATTLLCRTLPRTRCSNNTKNVWVKPSRSDTVIMFTALGSFLLPIFVTSVGLPPYMGLIAGLGLVWLLIDAAKKARPQKTHLQADIKKFFQQTDLESIQFFVGILLAVAALHALGLLDVLTTALLGAEPSFGRIVGAFTGLGVASAIVDNVPLTAAAISALPDVGESLWVLLALTVGTGGSLLIIGSAAGIIAMGMVPELTFGRYLRIGTIPAMVGFIAAVGVWIMQATFLM